MRFILISVDGNIFLMPADEGLEKEKIDYVLIERHDAKKPKPLTRLIIKPHTKLVVLHARPWFVDSFSRRHDTSLTAGMVIDKADLFCDDYSDEPSIIYPENDKKPYYYDFPDYDSAALWAAIQKPIVDDGYDSFM